MWVNYLLDACSPVVDHIVGRCEITFLKSVLSSAMTCKQVMLDTTFAINHCLIVVFELSIGEVHLTSLVGIIIDGG